MRGIQQMMTQPITSVHLSANLDNLNEIRAALSTNGRTRLLFGGNDGAHIYREIILDHPNWLHQSILSIPISY